MQHYLPQIYLKGFAAPNGEVWRYDRADGVCKPLPPQVIGAEKNLYSLKEGGVVSQEIENDRLNRVDSPFGPILRKLDNGLPLSSPEEMDLAIFIAHLAIRMPGRIRETELRNQQLNTVIGSVDETTVYHSEYDPAVASRGDSFLMTSELSGEVSKTRADSPARDEALKMLMTSATRLAEALFDLEWSLLSASMGRNFIVGDGPLAIVPPRSHPIDIEGVGPMTPGAATFVPLNSTLCLRMTNSGTANSLRRGVDGAAVRGINTCQVINSERYLFGPSETLLRKLTEGGTSRGLNQAVIVIREATSVSNPDSSLLHSFTKSKIPAEFAGRVPLD